MPEIKREEKRKIMNIKKQVPKLLSILLSFAMAFSSVFPAYAAEAAITESLIDGSVSSGQGWTADERSLEEIEVTYKQASSYFVTIPKTIELDTSKQASYSVKVTGDIDANQCVYVAPIDGIPSTENTDFYMEDQASENKKADAVATVTQNKLHWNSEEAANGYEETNNSVSASGLTAGTWKGTFQMEIKLESHISHVHNYIEKITKEPTCTEEGEKTYTCGCGDSYTEKIPATGHNFIDGECGHCGEKDPDHHEHDYKEEITKEPTCTEAGEKTYTCDCGDSYTEEIPATGHNFVDGECEHCGEKDPDYHKHSYTEEITKEATCTEEGEKTYTCDCGDSYTEKIPMTEHHYGDDDKCTECGQTNPNHIHKWEAYQYTIEPELVSSTGGSTYGTKWYRNSSVEDYDSYYCRDAHPGRYYMSDLRATFSIDLPEDYEGTFDYQYYYSCVRNTTSGASVQLKINNASVYKNVDGSITGTNSVTKTEPLSAGTNTFVVDFYTYNNNSTNSYLSTSQLSNATLRMYKIVLYDGSEYHICNACGEKEAHHFVDGVCIECGWHEGDHTHHYVDGVCDKCGKSETQYTLKIDYPDFLNEVEGISSNTQYIQDGDVFELPEKTDDAFDLSGYSIAKAVKNVLLCSSNYNTSDAIYVRNIGKAGLDAPLTTLDEFGLTVAEVSTSQPWRGTSVPTDYGWKQTAISDTIVIEKPCVYVFSVNEHQKCDNIYEASMKVSGSLVLEDITNSKSYTLTSLAASTQKTYDYDNVKIRCISKTVNNTSSTGKYDRTYKKTYMIYLNPGEYRLTASGSAGNGQTQSGSCIYSATISSPLGSTSTLAAPVINNVKHTAVGGTLYELVPIENGQEFDFSTMYTNENSTDIYMVSNWTAK